MQMHKEYLVVRVPDIFIDQTKYQGMDGRKILMFVYQNPELHIRNYGEVISTPIYLPATPLLENIYYGAPECYDRPQISYKKASDIERELQIGDKVYFHHNCLLPDKNTGPGSPMNKQYMFSEPGIVEGQDMIWHYFRIKEELVYAAVRYVPATGSTRKFEQWMEDKLKKVTFSHRPGENGDRYIYTDLTSTDHMYTKQIIPIGSWTFITPDVESWDDISIPTPETIAGKPVIDPTTMKPKLKPKEQWIVTKSMPGDRYLRGWVRYVGSPLKGDLREVNPGDYVYFRPKANTKTVIEGENFFRMRQRHIVCSEPARYRAIA